MKKSRILSAVVAAASMCTMAFLAAPSAHADKEISIIGGTQANSGWIVQIQMKKGVHTYGCTGEAISAEWILTARHCTDGMDSINIYYSNDTEDKGPASRAAEWKTSPKGDVALIRLDTAHPLSRYGTVTDTAYAPRANDSGSIYGYGARANGESADYLYTAEIKVLGSSTDAYGGRAIHIQGVTGAANHGDSGGPLIINGQIVGVCSTGDEADPGDNTEASSNYANLGASLSWIASTTS